MLKIFKNLSKKDWVYVAVSVVFIVAQVWLDLALPDYMKQITTYVQTPGYTMGKVWLAGGKMLLCAAGSLLSAIAVGFCAAKVSANFACRLRDRVFDRVQSFSMAEINRFSTASLITRSTNDITQVKMIVVLGMQVLIKAPIMATWAIIKIAGKSWQWSAATGVAVFLLLAMIAVIFTIALPRFKRIQTYTDDLNRVTRENLLGVRVVRAYNAEKYQENKFDQVNESLKRTHLVTMRTMSVMTPGMNIIMNGLSLAIYWIGAFLIAKASGVDRIGLFSDMIVFSSYAMQVVMSFMMLTMVCILLPRSAVSARRINEVLDTEPSIVDGPGVQNTDLTGEVEFQNVSFCYPDAEEPVLENVNFKVRKGETIAFIGSTGSGKSTVINLVPRFYDATKGKVLVDGVDVREYTLSQLHDKIGYVSQRAVMFSGTVASNVAYGQEQVDEESVRTAVEVAQAKDFVQKMEGEYDGEIAQDGTNVSGGQKQRLSIARAVYKKPEIYIFDDSFSALDYKTDRDLRAALKQYTGEATCMIVAQRIGTIKDADCIVVLDEGKMVGKGTHEQLLKNCKVYREIALSQLSEEELQ